MLLDHERLDVYHSSLDYLVFASELVERIGRECGTAARNLGRRARHVDLRGFGSTTGRKEAGFAGLEPDECYKLGKLQAGDFPDLAIEITVSRERLDKLKIYARLGVREVWRWNPSAARVLVCTLVDASYVEQSHSELLPGLDLAKLATFIRVGENQTRLIKAYRATL
jgi:Uma2 family endonuclease